MGECKKIVINEVIKRNEISNNSLNNTYKYKNEIILFNV